MSATNSEENLLLRQILASLPREWNDASPATWTVAEPQTTNSGRAGDVAGSMVLQLVTTHPEGRSPQTARPSSSRTDPGAEDSLADLVQRLAGSARTSSQMPSTPDSRGANNGAEKSRGGSVGSTILKTLGLATGMGPIAAGLFSLFGGGGKDEEKNPVEPILYELPESLSVEAGLDGSRQFTRTGYSESGVARSVRSQTSDGPHAQASAPVIQINVSAMDSRSFLDRSDDIARAVRDAMLHSHSINDVVSEL